MKEEEDLTETSTLINELQNRSITLNNKLNEIRVHLHSVADFVLKMEDCLFILNDYSQKCEKEYKNYSVLQQKAQTAFAKNETSSDSLIFQVPDLLSQISQTFKENDQNIIKVIHEMGKVPDSLNAIEGLLVACESQSCSKEFACNVDKFYKYSGKNQLENLKDRLSSIQPIIDSFEKETKKTSSVQTKLDFSHNPDDVEIINSHFEKPSSSRLKSDSYQHQDEYLPPNCGMWGKVFTSDETLHILNSQDTNFDDSSSINSNTPKNKKKRNSDDEEWQEDQKKSKVSKSTRTSKASPKDSASKKRRSYSNDLTSSNDHLDEKSSKRLSENSYNNMISIKESIDEESLVDLT